MGLFNPILGNIPQPDQNSKEVPFITPKSNYGATVTTPLAQTLFVTTLETTNTQTATYDTTKNVILTRVIIQGYYETGAVGTGTVDIYCNEVLLLSINVNASVQDLDKTQQFNYDIPLENVLINSNSRFKMISARTVGTLIMNCSFIGYDYTKQ